MNVSLISSLVKGGDAVMASPIFNPLIATLAPEFFNINLVLIMYTKMYFYIFTNKLSCRCWFQSINSTFYEYNFLNKKKIVCVLHNYQDILQQIQNTVSKLHHYVNRG